MHTQDISVTSKGIEKDTTDKNLDRIFTVEI